MNSQLPVIYKYLSSREYLKDYYRLRKEYDPGFSHSYICYRLGQRNSKSYFANVLAGIKPVTQEFINRFIELLELNADEAKYFRALVNYSQTYNPREKEYYFEQMLQRNTANSRLLTANEYAFYKEWHHSVIRALLDIHDFSGDYKKLAALVVPPITPAQARKSIVLLEKLNLIKKNERGIFKPTDKTIKTEDYVNDELIKHFQLHFLEVAKTTLLDNSDQPKDFSTNSLSISEEGLKKIQARLQKFREEIRALVHNDVEPADRVYQLDIQLFPNSRLPADKAAQASGGRNAKP